ncbi:MAG: hypothetical protein ABIQ44_15050 [Chloroflexia bacterium]
MDANKNQLPPNRLALYATLQSLTLVGCWAIFVTLWTFALFSYDMNNFEWWLLVAVACMGVYGLRPSLERAIDSAWLGDSKSKDVLAERVAQLRPIKRRIDIIFSVGVLALFVVGIIVWGVLLSLNIITIDS